MKKRLVSMLMIAAMAAATVAGCGSTESTGTQEATASGSETASADAGTEAGETAGAIDFDEDPYTINVPILTLGDSPADLELVEEKLNELLLEKINAQATLEVISLFDLSNTYTMEAAGGEKMDLINMLPSSSYFMPYAASNMLMPVDEYLEEYGQGIIEACGELLLAGQLNGQQYIIPNFESSGRAGASIEFNAELVKKYDLQDEIEQIHELSDLEPILEIIKENEPEVIPFGPMTTAGSFQTALQGFDPLCDNFGVLIYDDNMNDLQVSDWYSSDEFMDFCKLMHDWYQKGYISKDIITSQDTSTSLIEAGRQFCCINTNAPNQDYGFDLDNPSDGQVEWRLDSVVPYMTTYAACVGSWGIASSCERPDKAMQFLNLLYTDGEVETLLQRGIQDVDYTVNEDGLVVLDPTGGYYLTFGQFGYQMLMTPTVDMGLGYEEKIEEFEAETQISPAMGFVFDSTELADQIANCTAVVNEYYNNLDSGAVDPEVEIPKFIEKLNAAGYQEILEEKQRQLDEWAAQNK